jgi:hypothetical protein
VTDAKPTLLDRALAVYPLLATYILLLILYAWQTTRIPSPWIFTDELKWSLLSRSIAHTGRPEIREHAAPVTSLYSYFLAPAWWLGSTSPGYAAAKYLNAAVMTATIFPAYGLARLFLPRLASYLAAVATVAIPSLALTGVLMPESLAYFWSALALYAVARAILRPSVLRLACAVAACLLAPAMRSQLQVVIPAALIAGAVFVATSASARSLMRRWTWGDRAGAATLFLGGIIALDVLLLHHSSEWYIGTHFWHRALTYGLWAFGAFAIGVGVLPVLLALAWAIQGLPETREDRALLGLVAGTVTSFGVYTAVKASFLSTTLAIRVEERNLIYLSPIAFIAAGRWLLQARFRPVPVVVAGVGVGYLLWTTPYHAYEHLYSDAFGLSILQWLNQKWYWTNTDLKRLLFAILVVGALCTVAMRWRQRAATPIAVATFVLAVATIGWNLAGEIAAANASVAPGKGQRAALPTPPDWVDAATGRARTMFIGKALANSNWLWSFEFWNQSIQDVWSVDASVPPPGPGVTPNFLHTDGTLDPQLPVDYALTQPEIVMIGKIEESEGGVNLYTVPHPIRMSSFVSGITADGWMQDYSRFVRFAARPVSGTITVSISRGAACGEVPDAHFTFRVSRLRIDGDGQPVAAKRERVARATVARCTASRVLHIPARAPFRVDATATGLFRAGDGRELSAFVSYSFAPS